MTDRDQLIFFNNRLKDIYAQIDAYLGTPVAGPPDVVVPPPPTPVVPVSQTLEQRDMPSFGNSASNLFEFQRGVTYVLPIPLNSNGSLAPGGEGIYPEGLDMDIAISKMPGDFQTAGNMTVTSGSGGFLAIIGRPYINKVSNGSGIVWRNNPGGGAAYVPTGEQWWVNLRANNMGGRFILQRS